MKTKSYLSTVFLSFIYLGLLAQIPVKTDGIAMKAIITEIASDSYKGRKTGTEEGVKTEEYFASQFKKIGLLPAGEAGTYFHTYSLSEYDIKKAELVISDRSFLMGYDLDFDVMYYSSGGEAQGEIVFAGYGIMNTEKKRNDFDSLDMKGKVVLIRRGCPGNDYDSWGKSAIDSVKALYCYNKGAKGILFFDPVNFNTKQLNIGGNWIASVDKIKDFPIFQIREHVAKYILSSTKLAYYRMLREIDMKVVSFNTGKTIKIKSEVDDAKFKARNVLAMIPGSDPKLKKEYIIIGGHMDHVGVNAKNEVRNGADDNASGVAVTLGIAQAMVKNKFKPKRTIVFACWSGEEMGLLGSEAWCNKPTLDLYKTVVYFNLDMVGLGNGNLDMPGILYAPEVTDFIKTNTDSLTLKKINWEDGGLGGSDHNPFLLKGIPAFAGMTSGDHPNYHQPADDADLIIADILQFVGDFIYHSTEKLALSKANFISESRFEANRSLLKKLKCLTPVPYTNFVEVIEKAKPEMAIVDLSYGAGDNPDQNFLSILKNYEGAVKSASENSKMVFNSSAYDVVSVNWWSDNASLISSVNLKSIGYSEMYTKVLSKYGFRIGIMDGDFANYSDSITRLSFIKCANYQNIGLIINGQDVNKLHFVLEKSGRPVMILAKSIDLDDKSFQTIKENGHLLVYQVNAQNSIPDLLKTYNLLKEKVGTGSIAFTYDASDMKSAGQLKQLLVEIEKQLVYNEYINISERNFSKFVAKSLQDYPVKILFR